MAQQNIEQRKVVIVTSLGKKYSGMIDIPNAALRTTDLFNSSNIYWRNPSEKCFENAILMSNAQLILDDSAIYRKFDKIQVKFNEVLFFYDDFQTIGDDKEKIRATTLIEKTQEKPQTVNIITRMISHAFYDISGNFFGLFKKKSNDKFLPLTNVTIAEISKREGKWVRKEITLPHQFIGVGNNQIESATLG
ncbi:MAG: hypothetical protein A2511_00270 [Deltaproteobacteria bacterium RIFOXYD12_FULL_50_9]|nr:MAG: hypothetical protein A2511_00270 [Deltaproteobacteria bacterium RIFOXYD12_FULL_50_9]